MSTIHIPDKVGEIKSELAKNIGKAFGFNKLVYATHIFAIEKGPKIRTSISYGLSTKIEDFDNVFNSCYPERGFFKDPTRISRNKIEEYGDKNTAARRLPYKVPGRKMYGVSYTFSDDGDYLRVMKYIPLSEGRYDTSLFYFKRSLLDKIKLTLRRVQK